MFVSFNNKWQNFLLIYEFAANRYMEKWYYLIYPFYLCLYFGDRKMHRPMLKALTEA